ncbi:MAG: DUF4364 family protein [Oscillospiraceae bacterium]|nr:DUF4364 family protein [Oscillospiraceae bacterium]
MDRLGFIHEKLDIKLLILFVLNRLPGSVDGETLRELVMCDGGIIYFDYIDCLSELVTGGNVAEKDNGYAITEKGARNIVTVENSLPYSVRTKAEKLLKPLRDKMMREASIVATYTSKNGVYTVFLSMSDGKGELIRLNLVCGGEEQAKKIQANFRRGAEDYYQQIVALLCGDTTD